MVFTNFVYLFTLFIGIKTSFIVDPARNYTEINHFINGYFDRTETLTILSDDDEVCDGITLSSTNFAYKFIDNNFWRSHYEEGFLICSNSIEKIVEYAQEIKVNIKYFVRTSLIITKTITNDDRGLFLTLKKSSFKDVAIIDLETLKVHTYDQYLNYIHAFGINQVEDVKLSLKIRDFQKTTVSTAAIESTPVMMRNEDSELMGTDAEFIKLAAEKLNFTPFVVYSWYFGNKEENGSITGAFGMLYNKEIDTIFTQIFTKEYHIDEFVFTKSIDSDELCVVVPKMGQKPKWTAIFAAFQLKVWLLIVLCVTTFSVSLLFLRKANLSMEENRKLIRNSSEYDVRLLSIVSDTFRLVYNVAPSYFSRRPTEKIFMSIFLLFSVINTAAFQSSLSTVFTAPKYYKDLFTLEELAESNHLISTYSKGLMDTFDASDQEHMQILQARLKLLPYDSTRYDAFLARLTRTKYEQLLEAKSGQLITHTIPDCPQSYLLSYLTRKDSLILDEINDIIQGSLESGLYRKWYTDVVGKGLILKYRETVEIRAFTIEDLQTAFYVLFLGLSLSIGVFILESYHYM